MSSVIPALQGTIEETNLTIDRLNIEVNTTIRLQRAWFIIYIQIADEDGARIGARTTFIGKDPFLNELVDKNRLILKILGKVRLWKNGNSPVFERHTSIETEVTGLNKRTITKWRGARQTMMGKRGKISRGAIEITGHQFRKK